MRTIRCEIPLLLDEASHLAYFVGINLGYLLQNAIAAYGIRKYLQTAEQYEAENVFST